MTTPRHGRAAERAARRAAESGSGPTTDERPPARFPGATAKFALFGEVLMVGLLITLVGLPLVTLPAALAAGIRHLRRFVRAESSSMREFWHDVRRALVGGLAVGGLALVAVVVLVVDIDLARSGLLPGGIVVEIVGWAGLAAVTALLLQSAGLWSPDTGWRHAVRTAPASLRKDVPGAALLIATGGFVAVVTWVLIPLVIPALGCAALAVVAIPERPRARR